jgi:DNA-binding MarR family transcriptional regulator
MEIGEKSGTKIKDRIIIENGPTQVEIASACGCSRETVSRMVKSLVEKGRLSVFKKQYTLRPIYEPM